MNFNKIGDAGKHNKNLVKYIATREGVEKQGSHGLFSQTDEPIVLSNVADEVTNPLRTD